MASEVGNKSILRRIGKAFNILDVKQAPALLNTDEINTVVPLPFIAEEESLCIEQVYGPYNVDPPTVVHCSVIADNPSFQLTSGIVPPSTGFYYRVDSLHIRLEYDPEQVTTHAGNRFQIRTYFFRAPDDIVLSAASYIASRMVPIAAIDGSQIITLGMDNYEWAYPGSYGRREGGTFVTNRDLMPAWPGLVKADDRIQWNWTFGTLIDHERVGFGFGLVRMLSDTDTLQVFPTSTRIVVRANLRRVVADGSGVYPGR